MLMAMTDETTGDNWEGKDEVLNDMWVDESRKKRKDTGVKSATRIWKVLVVNDHVVNAFCLPGGKIVVFIGLLEHFRIDEEIATIIVLEYILSLLSLSHNIVFPFVF
ncbi:putative peptidase M48 [Helianthus debilis subsp. tardiflorus]